jgi:hypothetical protein
MARTLLELLDDLESLDDDLTIYADSWDANAQAVPALEAEDGATPPEAAGMTHALEVSLAKEAIEVWSAWRDGAVPTSADRVAAVIHYATHDAYLPIESDR